MKNFFKLFGLLIALLLILTALPASAQDATPEPEAVIDPASPPEVVVTDAPPMEIQFNWLKVAGAILAILAASTVVDDLYKYLVGNYFRPIKSELISAVGIGGWNVIEDVVQAAALSLVETYGKEAVNHLMKGFDVIDKSLAKAGINTMPEDRANLERMLSNKVRNIVLTLRE